MSLILTYLYKRTKNPYSIKTADEDDFIFLDSIYRSRYPAEEGLLPLGEPGAQEAKRAIKIAKGIVKKLVK